MNGLKFVRAYAPASVNLAAALTLSTPLISGDECVVRRTDTERVTAVHAVELPIDIESNTAGIAAAYGGPM